MMKTYHFSKSFLFIVPTVLLVAVLFVATAFFFFAEQKKREVQIPLQLPPQFLGYKTPHFSNKSGLGLEFYSDGTYSYIQNDNKSIIETRHYKVLKIFKNEEGNEEVIYILDYPSDTNDKSYTYMRVEIDYIRSLFRIAWMATFLFDDFVDLGLDVQRVVFTKGRENPPSFHLENIQYVEKECNCPHIIDVPSIRAYIQK